MTKKNILELFIAIFLAMFIISGCKGKDIKDVDSKGILIEDMLGRTITLNTTATKVAAIGPGALRLYTYVGEAENVVGVEQIEKDNPTGRPYILANPLLKDLQVIGPGGPNNSPDAEKILACAPDVIFTTYFTDKSSADALQTKTGIPVIALSYGKTAVFDEDVYKSIDIIGKVIGENKRSEDVVEFMKKCENDLNARTTDILDNEKPSTYIGALSMKGAHGIESTQGNYSLFNSVNAKNVVDETGKTGSVMIDKEKLIEWNPNIIFLDYSGFTIVKEDYNKNPDFYKTLKAITENKAYLVFPYNFYSTNIDTAIVNAYHIGKVLYPSQFDDINIENKADEIYEFLLGEKLYYRMEEDFGKLDKVIW